MSNILGSIFLGAASSYAKVTIAAELEVIKAHNDPVFFEKLLKSLDASFLLLDQATKNKTVKTVANIFIEPVEDAAKAADITL